MNKRGVLATIQSSGGGYTYKCLKHLGLLSLLTFITSIVSFSVLCNNVLFNTNNTHATSFSITTGNDPVLELNLSSNLLELNLTPKPDVPVFNTTNLTVTASTNNLTGYTLYMNVDNPNLTRTESLANNTTPSINSLTSNTEGYTESTFTTNSWGYHLSGDTNYFAIPTNELQLSTSTGPVNQNSTTITFASKVDMNQPAGTYTTNMTLYAITNAPIPTMQDVDNWRGSLAENQSIRAQDSRDGKYYWVLKAKDGHIWMTQNLDLDIDSTKTYTPQDTDLTANWTPVRSTIPSSAIASDGSIPDWENSQTEPYSLDPGIWFYTDTWFPFSDCPSDSSNNYAGCNYLVGNANGKFSQTPYSGNGLHGHVGNYYNWSATIASNNSSAYVTSTYDNPDNSPQTSICPAGWRLPIISSISARNEFQNLLVAYNSTTDDEKTLTSAPFFFIRAGLINSGGEYLMGHNGDYWSSTIISDVYSSRLDISPVNDINPIGNKKDGWSVRCLARSVATVTFDANGGEGTMPSQKIDERGSTLTMNTFTREGYVFAGWNTKADGTGTPYVNGANYTGSSTTLYAQWEFSPSDVSQLTYMQDFARVSNDTLTSIKNSMTTNTTYQLKDSRDEKTYNITKIGDIIWMTSNLAYNSTALKIDSTYGGYYKWDDAKSVCPTNWKLPSVDNFNTLISSYSTGAALTSAPWYGLYSGLYRTGTIQDSGSRGHYLTSDGTTSLFKLLAFNSSSASIINDNIPSDGISVRCIAK